MENPRKTLENHRKTIENPSKTHQKVKPKCPLSDLGRFLLYARAAKTSSGFGRSAVGGWFSEGFLGVFHRVFLGFLGVFWVFSKVVSRVFQFFRFMKCF